jgi:lipopolysaccharide transport system permease protein
MTLLFFLSGIFYSAQAVPESLRDYFLLLPTFALIEQFRRVIVYAAWPDPVSLLLICLLSTLTLALAVTLLRRFDRIYPRLVY